jgi:hypothetical protein
MISRRVGLLVMLAVTVIVVLAALCLPRIPQPQSYHHFADTRTFLGIPNFGDVTSNVAFMIVGIWGLVYLLRLSPQEMPVHFVDRRERWFYLMIFIGMLLTAFGSSYYHLQPDNARLVWDRLPMTIVFMSFVAALIAERVSLRAGLWLWPLLLLVGVGSVVQWYASELRGVGDLRFYAAVQTYSVVFLLMALMLPPRYTGNWYLAVIAGFYALAKILEAFDRQVFRMLGGMVSGHTLKHLAAAYAGYWILRMLQARRPIRTEARLHAPAYS